MPKTVFKCDATTLNNILSCKRKAKLYHIDNWRPAVMPNPMEKGLLGHEALKIYYREKMRALESGERFNRAATIERAIFELNRKATTGNVPMEELEALVKTLGVYFDYYETEGWIPKAVEHPFSVVLYEDDNLVILWEGIIDLVKDDQYGPGVVDHKFISRRRTTLEMSNQFMGYCWSMKIPMMIVNKIGFQKSLKPNERMQRQVMSYTPDVLEEWRENTIRTIIDWIQYYNANQFPPNFTSCDKYSGCIYADVCAKNPNMREFHLQTFYRKADKEWDVFTRDEDD